MRWLQTFVKVKTSANRIVKWQAAKPQKHKTDDVSCLPEWNLPSSKNFCSGPSTKLS